MIRSTLKIAVAQMPGNRLDQWREAWEAVVHVVEQAADAGAELVLTPECVWPAYYIESIAAYHRAREAGMPGEAEFLELLRGLARRRNIAISAGLVAERAAFAAERSGLTAECAGVAVDHTDRLSNDAVLVGADGAILGRHSKCFLWDFDNEFFAPGDALNPIQTPWGPIGVMICADARLPEIPATLAARGARLILQPTAWVNVGTPERLWNPQPALMIPQRARELGVPIASASKWGIEGGVTLVGSSLICDGGGRVLAQCGTSANEMITAEITLAPGRALQTSPRTRERLLSARPAETVREDVPPLRVVGLSARVRSEELSEFLADIEKPAGDQPTVYIANDPAVGIRSAKTQLVLSGPTDAIYECGGVRLIGLSDVQAENFAAARAAALEGVHCVVVFGEGVSADRLRCRAVENRIFIVHAAESGMRAYDPKGEEVTSDEAEVITLESKQAAEKDFAPNTNPFEQRRPACYEF